MAEERTVEKQDATGKKMHKTKGTTGKSVLILKAL